jgi:hypothetical protein
MKKFAIFLEVDLKHNAPPYCLGCFPGAQQAVLPKTVSLFPENQEKDNLENAKPFLEEQLVGRRGSTLNQGWAKLAPTLQPFLFDIFPWGFCILLILTKLSLQSEPCNLPGLARGARQTFSLLMIYSAPGSATLSKYIAK